MSHSKADGAELVMTGTSENPVNALILARNLEKRFGELQAVVDVSLEVKPGEIYGLVGPDGAGKTTTLRLLCGALRPDRGEIVVAGYDLNRQLEKARGHLGYFSQRFSLYEDLTVMENLRFFGEVRGLSTSTWRERCLEILQFVGLDPYINRLASNLSGGMKQKLALAAALVHQPEVLLLDEPTRGVDPVTRQDFWQLIIRLAGEENIAVLASTTYMDEAARCSKVGLMQGGRLVVEGHPETLREHLAGRILELRGEPLPLLRQVAGFEPDVEAVHTFGDHLHLRVREGTARRLRSRLRRAIRSQGGQVAVLRVVRPELEDAFIYLLEGKQ